MHTHGQIINRLGGQRLVALMLHRDKSTISRWSTCGIPPHAWPIVIQLAKECRVRVTLKQLADASPRYGLEGASPHRIPDIAKVPQAASARS